MSQNRKPERELLRQIRERINRTSSHPGLISISFEGGKLFLSGPVLSDELRKVIKAVYEILPVEQVESRLRMLKPNPLRPHAENDVLGVAGPLPNPMSTAMRFALGVGSAAAVWTGWRRGTLEGYLFAAFGLGGIVRAITNIETTELIGSVVRPFIRMKRRLTMPVPVEHAFSWWNRFENYPAFMSYVTDVAPIASDVLRWTVSGPGGIPLNWRASYRSKQNELIEWKSLPGSLIMNQGRVLFSRLPYESTCLDIELSYAPPAGAIGYNVARVLGFNPKRRIDSDLAIMKELILSDFLKSA